MKAVALLLLLPCLAVADELPTGWHAGGRSINLYEATRRRGDVSGTPELLLRSKELLDGSHWGNISSHFAAEKYRGHRIRYSARVRSDDVTGWAGLWMRIDGRQEGEHAAQLGFDNMQNRAIKGTKPWTRYEIVLDVPPEAEVIYFGILMNGGGMVLLEEPNVEIVGNDVPVTGGEHALPREPQLDLSK